MFLSSIFILQPNIQINKVIATKFHNEFEILDNYKKKITVIIKYMKYLSMYIII